MPKPNDGELHEEDELKFNFSYVECLMFAFHLLGRFHPEFLAADENKERLKDFRLRLQYFAKGTQNYIKELRNSLSNTSITSKENEEVNRNLYFCFQFKINEHNLFHQEQNTTRGIEGDNQHRHADKRFIPQPAVLQKFASSLMEINRGNFIGRVYNYIPSDNSIQIKIIIAINLSQSTDAPFQIQIGS